MKTLMSKRAAFAALTAALISASPLAADDHATDIPGVETAPMSALDLITTPRLGGPTVTTDGKRAIYRVTETDPDTLERSGKYYLINLEEPELPPRELQMEFEGAHSLQWGASGLVFYIASDADAAHTESIADTQIYSAFVNSDGSLSENKLISTFKVAPDGFKLSPREDKIAVWANIPRDCASLRCELPENSDAIAGTGRLYEYDAGFFRHWDQWVKPGFFNRTFVYDIVDEIIDANGTALDGIDPETGLIANTPTMPFGGGEDIAWAADGKGVFFVGRETGREEPTSTDLDIYFSDLSGSAPVELTASNTAVDTGPAPSPDGKYLAYLAMERPGYESDRMVVHLRDLETGETRALTQDFDRSFGGLSWTADGSAILATAADVLDTPVFRIDPESGAVERLDLMAGNEAHIGNVTPIAGNRLLFTRDSIGAPSELYLSDGYTQARPLTDVAMTRMGTMASTVTTRFSFPGAEGNTVWGQITRLENQTGPIPAILYIHGGPQGSFRDGWSSRWNPRVVASQGYAVISVDFHGSAGYGQEFMDAINQDWGGKPLIDLQLGLAAALNIDRQIDGGNACAMGASYGGYMVNWIAGNWPDGFSCLVQHDGLFDMRSFYYSTEELWFPRWDFGGSYSDARETYERWNPVNHVDKWKTPMLVIAGERDFRVPYTQGLQSFTALQERNIPSQLLVFPDENHWVLGAENSLQWHNTVFDWLDQWLVQEVEVVRDSQ
ncbi:MAG: S9 family peptidase [Pseudomonadota bacterium]